MEDYPQPVTGLIKDKSTEKKKASGYQNEVYNDDQFRRETIVTKNNRVDER